MVNFLTLAPQQVANNIKCLTDHLAFPDVDVVSKTVENLAKILDDTTVISNLGLLEQFQGAVINLKNLIAGGAWEADENEISLIKLATNAMFNFTKYGGPGVGMLMKANVLPALMPLLAHDDNEVRGLTIVLVFGMLHKGPKAQIIEFLMESNFLENVPGLLSSATNLMTKEYTLHCLNTILEEGTRAHYRKLTNIRYLPFFLDAVIFHFKQFPLQGDNVELKLETAVLLTTLWKNGLRHGYTPEDLTKRFSTYNITQEMIDRAIIFRDELDETITLLKFARIFNLQ